MAYKLIDAAQARWRAVNAPHLVAIVRAGKAWAAAKNEGTSGGRHHEHE